MMNEMMGSGMMWGMGVVGIIGIIVIVLVIAALIKYRHRKVKRPIFMSREWRHI
jgi:heme/copper-type cytochrome/quinol oxidase subunit 2